MNYRPTARRDAFEIVLLVGAWASLFLLVSSCLLMYFFPSILPALGIGFSTGAAFCFFRVYVEEYR